MLCSPTPRPLKRQARLQLSSRLSPAALAQMIADAVSIPTIGIGAGAGCDSQILVYQDMLGMFSDFTPKFVKRYANVGESCAKRSPTMRPRWPRARSPRKSTPTKSKMTCSRSSTKEMARRPKESGLPRIDRLQGVLVHSDLEERRTMIIAYTVEDVKSQVREWKKGRPYGWPGAHDGLFA